MANTPQAKKRIRRNERRAEINGARVSRIRTFVKKVELALIAGDKDAAGAALQEAQQRRVITQLLGERELLDQRQRAVLMALLLSRYENEATKEELPHRDQ